MNALNSLLSRLSDLLFAPLAGWPLLTLCLFSAIVGVLMAWVFRHTSNQRALGAVANRIRAQLFAIKLFKDDLGVTFRCQVELFKATGLRLWYSLPPMLVMLVPLMLVLIQLATRYEVRPLKPGETAIVELQLAASAWDSLGQPSIEAPEAIVVETAALRDASRHTIFWRIRPEAAATGTLRFTVGEQVVEKTIIASDEGHPLVAVSPRRPGTELLDRALYPLEPAFDETSPVQAIAITYPQRSTPLLGFDIPWWLTFFIVSMLAAVVARPWLKVQF